MFERSFLWAMKHGARVLFAIGLAYLASGLFGTLTTSGLLLFGALVVDRRDRWLSSTRQD
jgi:small-conductance mechanosensitive channel